MKNTTTLQNNFSNVVYSHAAPEQLAACESPPTKYARQPQMRYWKAFAVTCLFTVSAISSPFLGEAFAANAIMRLSNATVELSDPSGPTSSTGTSNQARAYRKVSNIVGAEGQYMGSSVSLSIVGALVLDESRSRITAAPNQQRQVYAGTYRLTMIASDGTQRMVDIDATTTATFAPQEEAVIRIAFRGRVVGGAQQGIPAYVSGTFRSQDPLHSINFARINIRDIVMDFDDVERAARNEASEGTLATQ